MQISNSIKVGVISSLIASVLFLYLLDPILRFLSNIVFFVSDKVSSYFVDKLYQEIAIGRTDYSLTLLVMINITLMGIINLVIVQKIKLKKKTTEIEDPERKEEARSVSPKAPQSFYILTLILFNLLLVLQLVSSHIKISSINTFDQYVRIITPYIDNSEKQILISRFSSMKTYSDFNTIMRDIKIIASGNKISLPEQKYTYTY